MAVFMNGIWYKESDQLLACVIPEFREAHRRDFRWIS